MPGSHRWGPSAGCGPAGARRSSAGRRETAWARAGRAQHRSALPAKMPSSWLPRVPRPRRPALGSRDAHDLLVLLPHAKLSCIDEPVDDVRVVLDAVVDELRLGVAKHE